MPWKTPLLLALIVPASVLANEQRFSPEDILDWESRSFQGETHYAVKDVDGRPALQADCEDSASGLYREANIDLGKTPIIEWYWRIESTFGEDIDETRRAGDDYPVRLYLVKDGGWRRWQTRAVNYVWASAKEKDSEWPNAYTRRAMMLALQSGEDKAGQWVRERRLIADDFERLHGERPQTIDAIAIMSDCDDTGEHIRGWYGEIRLLPE
ncbi:DUF3047 domain-containing protein [Natronospira bacteriovora]|uniref:DUF3047 domain-containing protein n=1 Tax=Natronospira bacteriovora TaxID=3069753 RepID=A0ABU0W579_9GAMM|nr:DUF3047 domain-containing protein [Natronospira sp. AB-CW4]MDQ2069176.1 DUF3047 domain-containing protein [Natronospira sp. AB-CW4]